jgi:hypothetical protein
MRDLVIQLPRGEYRDFASYLLDRGFESVVLNAPGARFMSKRQLLWQ